MKKKDQNTKVSVILPIYNAQDYLKECVESVINQTYSNIQIILVNDGSNDNSWKICQELEKKDNRIIAVTQKNSGVSVARNKGLKIANGDWIMFVDPDDVLNRGIIEKLLLQSESNIDIVSCCCYGFDENGKTVDHFFEQSRDFESNKTDLYLQLLNPSYGQPNIPLTAIGVPWGKIYRKRFIEKYNLKFDPKLRRMQDNLFNMYAFYYARNIRYLDIPLYFYRLSHVSNYNEKHLNNFMQTFLPVLEARYEGIFKLNLNKNPKIYNEYINEIAGIFLNIVKGIFIVDKNKEKKLNDIINKEYVKILFHEKDKIKNKKNKIKLYLIEKRKYKSYGIIMRLLAVMKK